VSITIEFVPWSPFRARKKPEVIRRWLNDIGKASERAFKNMKGFPPASSPGEYPAIRTGRLRGSINYEVTDNSVTIGSNMPYSIFLRSGTSKMARRKMSDNALQEGMRGARLGHWVEWTRS
jgi:phage gpG-like protein